jgi:hypothetical protein
MDRLDFVPTMLASSLNIMLIVSQCGTQRTDTLRTVQATVWYLKATKQVRLESSSLQSGRPLGAKLLPRRRSPEPDGVQTCWVVLFTLANQLSGEWQGRLGSRGRHVQPAVAGRGAAAGVPQRTDPLPLAPAMAVAGQ